MYVLNNTIFILIYQIKEISIVKIPFIGTNNSKKRTCLTYVRMFVFVVDSRRKLLFAFVDRWIHIIAKRTQYKIVIIDIIILFSILLCSTTKRNCRKYNKQFKIKLLLTYVYGGRSVCNNQICNIQTICKTCKKYGIHVKWWESTSIIMC